MEAEYHVFSYANGFVEKLLEKWYINVLISFATYFAFSVQGSETWAGLEGGSVRIVP